MQDESRMAELLKERAARVRLLIESETPRADETQDWLQDRALTAAWVLSLPHPTTARETNQQFSALMNPQNLMSYANEHQDWSTSIVRHLDEKIGPGGKWIPQASRGGEWTPETWQAYIESVMSDWLPPAEPEAVGTDPG